MQYPVWLTTDEIIGTIGENSFYSYKLSASEQSGKRVTYTVISGGFPPGISLDQRTGELHGTAMIPRTEGLSEKYTYTATVRAAYSQTEITDRTFRIDVNSMVRPIIIPESTKIGDFVDGEVFYYDLNVIEPNPSAVFTWSLVSGKLPPGITLNQAGEISGYLIPMDFAIPNQYTYLNRRGSYDGLGFSSTPYSPPVSNLQYNNAAVSYIFSVEVSDGINTDVNSYSMTVTTRLAATTDSTILAADNTVILTNTTPEYNPVITNIETELPSARQRTDYMFRVTAVDYSLHQETITFSIVDQGITSFLPNGLSLDVATGWITGHLAPQIEDRKTYTFTVIASKTVINPETELPMVKSSLPATFSMTVLGDLHNTITWLTPEDLGSVFNGDVSELRVQATAPAVTTGIRYTWNRALYDRLPNGIKLTEDGLLVGRFPFNHFVLDNSATTFDKGELLIDTEFTFTVHAEDYHHTVSSDKAFRLRINNKYKIPYENIYLKALLPVADRELFNSIISNSDIFPPALLYRQGDSYFGKSAELKFLFLPGLDPTKTEDYAAATYESHYTKRINLGEVKTAVATDAELNVKYEVVYVEVVDDLTNAGQSIKTSGSISTKNPYFTAKGERLTKMTPNSYYLMQKRITDAIDYSNKGALPDWMTAQQEKGQVLGLTRAIVLAYTVPGAAKLIAYRLRANGIVFNNLNFDVDRYILDNQLSKHFDVTAGKFTPAKETTFDRLSPISTNGNFIGNLTLGSPVITNVSVIGGIGTIVGFTVVGSGIPLDTYITAYDANAHTITLSNNCTLTKTALSVSIIAFAGSVDFAVITPYELIHNRSVAFIKAYGGFDLLNSFKNGDRLIFARQEFYTTINSPALSLVRHFFDANNFDTTFYSPGQSPVVLPELHLEKNQFDNEFGIGFDYLQYSSSEPPMLEPTVFDPTSYFDSGIFENTSYDVGLLPVLPPALFDPYSPAAAWYDPLYPETVAGHGAAVWGYLTHTLYPELANRRMGIWEINIDDNNLVTLVYVKDVTEWQYVYVTGGQLYKDTKLYFNPVVDSAHGFTVPAWSILTDTIHSGSQVTTFDKNSTRFYNHRDTYMTAGVDDKYIKFQQRHVLMSANVSL